MRVNDDLSVQLTDWSDHLQLLLSEAGLSPESAAKAAGLSGDTVRRWLKLRCDPRFVSLRRLEKALEVELGRPVDIPHPRHERRWYGHIVDDESH